MTQYIRVKYCRITGTYERFGEPISEIGSVAHDPAAVLERWPWGREDYRRFIVEFAHCPIIYNLTGQEAYFFDYLIETGEMGFSLSAHRTSILRGCMRRLQAKGLPIERCWGSRWGSWEPDLPRRKEHYILRCHARQIAAAIGEGQP